MPEAGAAQKVVVAFLDKRRDRGLVYDFKPTSEGFTLHPEDDRTRTRGTFIEFRGCKAVYFVKSLTGNKEFKENKSSLPAIRPQGKKITVCFRDGEKIVGITEGFLEGRPGFFFYPGDPKSNNIQIFAVTSNVEEIRVQQADAAKGDKIFRPEIDQGVFLPEKRLEAVQRLLRGEPIEKLAKELYVNPATLAGWKARFLSGGPGALGVTGPVPGPASGGGPKIR